MKFAEPNMKSKHWLEYGCHCFADIKNDILTPGHGRTIDKIGIDITHQIPVGSTDQKVPKSENWFVLKPSYFN